MHRLKHKAITSSPQDQEAFKTYYRAMFCIDGGQRHGTPVKLLDPKLEATLDRLPDRNNGTLAQDDPNDPALPFIAKGLSTAANGDYIEAASILAHARRIGQDGGSIKSGSTDAEYFSGAVAWAQGKTALARHFWKATLEMNGPTMPTDSGLAPRSQLSAKYMLAWSNRR